MSAEGPILMLLPRNKRESDSTAYAKLVKWYAWQAAVSSNMVKSSRVILDIQKLREVLLLVSNAVECAVLTVCKRAVLTVCKRASLAFTSDLRTCHGLVRQQLAFLG